jgi:NDP-sugar pyrophosphorylase family protein
MKIIIPMSGLGQRFINAGFNMPKPLINVINKTIIEYVVNLFSDNDELIFICNKSHNEQHNIKNFLLSKFPKSHVEIIDNHKYGPVYAVTKVYHLIKEDDEVIINYCDFNMDWNYNDFKTNIKLNNCDASIVAYTGFHPHLLIEKNIYAGCKIDSNNILLEIKEKYSYEKNKMLGYHSTGTYYFKKFSIMKKYFNHQIDNNIHLNNEFYVSLCFNKMIEDEYKVYVYDKVKTFCQWGTPEDLNDFFYYYKIFS